LRIATPLALYYLTEVAMGLTDMVIVGRLGSDELAAVGLSAGIVIESIIVCFGVLSLVGVLSSHALGRGQRERVAAIVGQGFWVALLLAAIVVTLTARTPDLFRITGQDPVVIRLGQEYLAWMIWVTPFALGFVVLRNFLTALSRTAVIACVTVPAVGLNLLLNYLLVFGAWGLPPMGVAGAGLASVIVNCLMVIALLAYVRLNRDCREFPILRAAWRPDLKICGSILKLGTPAGVTALIEGGLFVVVGLMMGTLGADWLAANEILFHILPMAFVVALAIGESAAVRVAWHDGAGNVAMTRWTTRTAMALAGGVMLSAALVLWLFPEPIVGLFIDVDAPDNADVVAIALSLTSIAAIFQLFDGLQVVALWCLRGLRDTLFPMLIASAGYWLCGLGSGYWLGFVLDTGATGVWWGLAAGLTITGVLLATRLYLLLRARERAIGSGSPVPEK
jgi:MATE family multidrug resistance protein